MQISLARKEPQREGDLLPGISCQSFSSPSLLHLPVPLPGAFRARRGFGERRGLSEPGTWPLPERPQPGRFPPSLALRSRAGLCLRRALSSAGAACAAPQNAAAKSERPVRGHKSGRSGGAWGRERRAPATARLGDSQFIYSARVRRALLRMCNVCSERPSSEMGEKHSPPPPRLGTWQKS